MTRTSLLGTTDRSKALSSGPGWAVNATVAEGVNRRRTGRRSGQARTQAASATR